jgi:cytochrome oxidase Cu insertion factor (SCO1/SenC/PrrC family)
MANAAADPPVTETPSGPIFDFKPHPPGTYTLYKIKAASDGRVVDTAGKPRALSDFFGHGKVTLQSFIYSSCADPNGCPYAYTVFHYLKNKLQSEHPDVADKVRLVSLSFDPVRDTPEMLRLYAGENVKARDGVEWRFLTTSSLADLVPILDAYGQDVYIDLDPKTQQPLSTMSHVLKVFLIDRHGITREIYTASYLQPEAVYNDILTLLLEDGVIQQ